MFFECFIRCKTLSAAGARTTPAGLLVFVFPFEGWKNFRAFPTLVVNQHPFSPNNIARLSMSRHFSLRVRDASPKLTPLSNRSSSVSPRKTCHPFIFFFSGGSKKGKCKDLKTLFFFIYKKRNPTLIKLLGDVRMYADTILL